MRTLLLAAVASAALTIPALAQSQTPSNPPPATNQSQAQANGTQKINPSTLDQQQVKQIQQALDKAGHNPGSTNGKWDSKTQQALANFQKSKNMPAANGELNDATLTALNLDPSQFGQGQAASMQTQANTSIQAMNPSMLDHQQVEQIQQALNKAGFSTGHVDGIWGPDTRTALMNFQKSKNMGAANGELNHQTLAALKLNPREFAQNQSGAAPMGKAP
jgi:predicted 2-oxoglutarate/Fe(II)-dependent dioxygenase YbiX